MERRLSGNDLTHEYTKTPYINFERVAHSTDYLRRQVLRRSTIGLTFFVGPPQLPGKAKVNQFDMASIPHREYNVLRFQITVYDIIHVKVLQSL